MAGIVQSGDHRFWELRARELILEAQMCMEVSGDRRSYHERIEKAIALLALAKAHVPEDFVTPGVASVQNQIVAAHEVHDAAVSSQAADHAGSQGGGEDNPAS